MKFSNKYCSYCLYISIVFSRANQKVKITQGTNSLSYIADSVEVRGYKLDLQLKKRLIVINKFSFLKLISLSCDFQ